MHRLAGKALVQVRSNVGERGGRRRMARALSVAILIATAWVLVASAAGAGRASRPHLIDVEAPRVVVIKSQHLLHLFDGHKLLRTYPAWFGETPSGDKRYAGDGRTPEGVFTVGDKRWDTPYGRFVAINYPSVGDVDRAERDGVITPGEADHLRGQLARGISPRWNTALGGGIGIHGGAGHGNWTAGCIALADEHVHELFDVLRTGDRIEILP